MLLALKEAEKGRGKVSPNPMVGVVLLKRGKIVGKAFHHGFGKPHAEAELLKSFPEEVTRGATLVVNLEPCNHYGKTPPCTELIVNRGIKTVVISTMDPNPLVAGRGIKCLREHGIEVIEGVCREEAIELNLGFFISHLFNRPFIKIKYAQSLDSKIGIPGKKRLWISNDKSRLYAHELRACSDAILVGIETVFADDPVLNVRNVSGFSPKRIILDSYLRISSNARVINTEYGGPTILFVSIDAPEMRKNELEKLNVQIERVDEDSGELNLFQVVKKLKKVGINALLVEGGSRVITSFVKRGLYDDIEICIAPRLLGKGLYPIREMITEKIAKNRNQLKLLNIKRLEDDVWLHYRNPETIEKLGDI